jgi:hypothetical protein
VIQPRAYAATRFSARHGGLVRLSTPTTIKSQNEKAKRIMQLIHTWQAPSELG